MSINWNEVKIRCSCLGALFTEPKLKVDKEAGNLSATAKSHLIEVYARELWGVETELHVKPIKKGRLCESDAITTLSRLDKRLYIKNDERKDNPWISGECDIDNEPDDEVIDIKVPVDAISFLSNVMGGVDRDHELQLQGYMWLWNRKKARVCYVLEDMPDSLIEGEKYSLLRQLDVATEESPEFKKAWAKRLTNLKFSHLPIEQRVIAHSITRDEEVIEKIPAKVEKAREFLAEFHEKHLSAHRNLVTS